MLPVHTCSSSRRPAEAPSAAHTMPGALAARTLGWQQMRAHQYVRRHAAAVPLFGHRVGARGQGQVELRIKGERERPRACAALHLAVESGSGVEGAKADASPARARQRAETAVARSMVGRESAAVGGAAGGRAWRVCARACVRECVGANARARGRVGSPQTRAPEAAARIRTRQRATGTRIRLIRSPPAALKRRLRTSAELLLCVL